MTLNDRILAFAAVVGVSLVTACASAPSTKDVAEVAAPPNAVTGAPTNTALRRAVALGTTTGGAHLQDDHFHFVDDALLAAALTESMRRADLLAAGNADRRYVLHAQMVPGPASEGAFDVTARVTVNYTLIDVVENKTVFSTRFTTVQTVTVGEKLVGMARKKMAAELALRQNFTQLVQFLYRLN